MFFFNIDQKNVVCKYQPPVLIMYIKFSAPYCIAKVLANASEGKLDEGFAFAGSNAYKCTNIVPVKVLIEQLVDETIENLDCCN